MKILTRYLFREIFNYFFLFFVMFTVIILVNNIYTNLDDFLRYSTNAVTIVMRLIYSIPELLGQTLPMICLLATIFSYGLLAKNKEILAMVASGISFYRLALPALVFGLALTAFSFWFYETVVPASASQAEYIKKILIKRQKESIFTKNDDLLVKGEKNRYYCIKVYDSQRKEMLYPTILQLSEDNGNIIERIDAARGVLEAAPIEKGADKGYWVQLYDAERWRFNKQGLLAGYEKFTAPLRMKVEESIDLFLSRTKKPDQMNYQELRQYVTEKLALGDDVRDMRVRMQFKLSFPVSCLLMALLGFSVIADVHARRFAKGVSIGLLVSISFYLLNSFFNKMADKGALAPELAGWASLALVGLVVIVLVNRLKKIRG